MSYGGGVFSTADPPERKYKRYSDSQLLRRLLTYIMKYRKGFATVLISLLLTAAVGVIGPLLLGFGVNDILAKNYGGLVVLILLYSVVYVANYFSDNKRTYHMQVVGQNVLRNIRRDAFVKLQHLSPSYFTKRETGRIMSYITNDVDALSDFITFQLPQVLAGFVVIASIITIMFLFNFYLTLVSLSVVPPLVVLTLAFQGRIQKSFVETRKKIAIVTSKLQEGITGVRVTQSFVEEGRVSQNFDEVNSGNLGANLRANKLTSAFNALVQVIESAGMAFVLWYGAVEILSGQIPVGTLITFLLYVNAFFNPIIQLTTFYNSYQSAVTGLDRVLQLLDTEVEVQEPREEELPPLNLLDPSESQSDAVMIEFQNVTFGYDPAMPILKNINLKIRRGEVVAVVGATGAGKSTLVNLMLRFYDPQRGSVMIDGVDVRNIKFSKLHGMISIVPQDPFLFSPTTIVDNIRYSKPRATDEEVIEIAKKVGVDDFVGNLPLGYNMMISEGATNVSMGQKQLICFARALLPDPKIVIMDEATSGVDPVTELQLQRALVTMLKGRTAVIIAHRLSTIRLADEVVVLSSGQIVEQGSFSELMSLKEGIFSKMYSMQQVHLHLP